MRIYIAGKYEARHRLRVVRDEIERTGHQVISSWIDTDESRAAPVQTQREWADRDFAQIEDVDMFIIDTHDPSEFGGREVELGFALGNGFSYPCVWRVGPARNIFHHLVDYALATWDEAVECLAQHRALGGAVA